MSRILSSLSWRRVRRLQVVEGSFVFLSLLSSGQWQDARKRRSWQSYVQCSRVWKRMNANELVALDWFAFMSLNIDWFSFFYLMANVLSLRSHEIERERKLRNAQASSSRSNMRMKPSGATLISLLSFHCLGINQWIPSSFWSQRQEVTIRKMKMY